MGGRGSYSKGNIPEQFTYETIAKIRGIKVVVPVNRKGSFKLPEEAKSSKGYVIFNRSGVFQQYREYNEEHKVVLEIGYHHENQLQKKGESGRNILHVHVYEVPGVENHKNVKTYVLKPGDALYERYKFLFLGVTV